MLTVRLNVNFDLIALQDLDTEILKIASWFSKKFRAETSEDMEKLKACVGHYNHSYFSFIIFE